MAKLPELWRRREGWLPFGAALEGEETRGGGGEFGGRGPELQHESAGGCCGCCALDRTGGAATSSEEEGPGPSVGVATPPTPPIPLPAAADLSLPSRTMRPSPSPPALLLGEAGAATPLLLYALDIGSTAATPGSPLPRHFGILTATPLPTTFAPSFPLEGGLRVDLVRACEGRGAGCLLSLPLPLTPMRGCEEPAAD